MSSQSFDFFIFIHPLESNLVGKQLESFVELSRTAQDLLNTICDDPFRLHVMPCSSYLGNWRWYFRYLGAQFQEKVFPLYSTLGGQGTDLPQE